MAKTALTMQGPRFALWSGSSQAATKTWHRQINKYIFLIFFKIFKQLIIYHDPVEESLVLEFHGTESPI